MINRIGLLLSVLLLLPFVALAANGDPARRLVTDLTEEQIRRHHGPFAGSLLTPQDRALISSFRFAEDSIHVLAILVEWSDRPATYAPGVIETSLTADLRARKADKLLGEIPLGRFGHPREVASVISFLLSEDASYVTGQCINIDGGTINT